ncbi:multicopper oxidase domain-containing protein [Corynebacterium minutissimum]|uniref:Copper-containing nitrite reductase n=1 Tax=Corynebacterium minutissimum TaxID=38301 RepID=A0A2X4UC86_9CORY|nr:multicopper oxidase domain-containing protein [Corynebacterium minutissimum]KHO29582.1 membrane protein [Corynebacterium minutissimum]QPS58712.1 multicopper oxidase domain-containing protein [Corynebacterium minutissimum]QQA80498.1 multicopper oxidase domain-containing protein [Corynebacterium minutissimum]SQI00175.1 major outer membrane protein [Corynebacterium minutissimum]VEG05758.1 major outer membrane protein [Corynebacterium minutissimum]
MSSAPAQAPETKKWAAWLIIILALVAVIGLAVMNSTTAQRGATSAAPADATTIDVSVDGMSFVPNSVDVPAGTHLVVNFTNTGDQVHDLKIGSAETNRVDPGDSVQIDAGIITESVEGYCTIAGHKIQGMTFMVNVTDAPADGSHMASGHNHGVVAPANVPSLAERMAPREDFEAFDPVLKPAKGTVHEETWTMTEEEVEVAPGVRQTRWLFNGQAPGPTLRGTVGDTFRITIKNEGSMGHSVDFHAGEVTPNEAMKTIQPGESLTYEFVAHRAGAWMYHCSTMPMSLHIANGMAGAVIIDPKGEDALSDVDAEYLLTSAEVFLAAEGSEAEGADPQRVSDGSYDLTSFNYYPNQYDDGLAPLHAKVGDTVRIWLVNLGPDLPLSFHVVGEIFDTVYKEGAYLLQDAEDSGSQAVDLLPAQGGFVEMTFNEPGTYSFVNHIMTNAEKGQHGQIIVE